MAGAARAGSRGGPAEGRPSGSLRETALRSGAYLTVREVMGAVIRLAGLVAVTRQIGPAAFGVYGAAAAYLRLPTALAQMGSEVFVVRQPGPLPRRTYDEVFTVLLVSSGVVVAAGLGLSFLLAPWFRPAGVLAPLRVLLFAIPINICWAPYQGCIERRFAYRRMGLLELGGDVALYGTAVPLALLGYGAWSLVAGFFVWQAWLLAGSIVLSGAWPRLAWSNRTARALVAHGRTYSLGTYISSARSAIVTVIVATYAGATGVGLMNFATRFVGTMNFTDRGVHRVGMAAISRAHDSSPGRLAAGLEEGTLLLLVVLAVPLALFGLSAHWVIPDVFGRSWLPALPLYALLALWAVLHVPMTVQRTLLYARGRNMPPAVTSAIELVIVSLVSLVAVRELGIIGYGIATVAGVGATVYTYVSARQLVVVRYRRLVVPLVGLAPAVCVPLAPLPWSLVLLLPPVLLLVSPTTRRELARILATARATIARGREASRRAEPGTNVEATAMAHLATAPALQVTPVTSRNAGAGAEVAMNGAAPGSWGPLSPGHQPYESWRRGLPAADGAGDGLATPSSGPGGLDRLAELLVESDPVTGLPSAAALLARLGRILGAADEPGWALGLVALQLVRSNGVALLAVPSEELLSAIAAALRAELRFDDVVARIGPRTFVAVVPLVDGDAQVSEVAAHLDATVRAVVASSSPTSTTPPGAAWTVRTADVVVPLPCDHQADLLVRQAVEAVRG
jgi:O-antigen/teichoic acid export membrane protein/GGDEF domain-containing protein